MYASSKEFKNKDRRKTIPRALPAYAYSRGVELHCNKNSRNNLQSDPMYDPRRTDINISYPLNVFPEFDLPNEQQISYYEQLMMKSNETIILSNFLDNQESSQLCSTVHKKPVDIQEKILMITPSSEIIPFYKMCFEIMKLPKNDLKWKLSLISEHSTDIRSEIQQIYLHMRLYYNNYMQRVNLGVLDTCNRLGSGQFVTVTERFKLTLRDDYLMATQIFILFKHILSDQNTSSNFKQMMENLELWKNLLQKMSTNPKVYEFSLYNNISLEMTELLNLLIKTYFKTRHYLETYFILMINNEKTMKEQQVKDNMLNKYWYSMVDTPKKI